MITPLPVHVALLAMTIFDRPVVLPPPLPESAIEALSQVVDDQDAPDAGFIELLNHVRSWPPGAGSIGPRLGIDHDALIEHPGDYRGELLVIEGQIEQAATLARPLETVQEWFVRSPDGRPAMVYVPLQGILPVQPGDDVVLEGYFYKRLQIEDRQGVSRAYPVFIGGQPRVVAGVEREVDAALRDSKAYVDTMVLLIAGVAVLLLVVVGLLLLTRRSKRRTRLTGIFDDVDSSVPDPPLPEDPAGALGELKHRNCEDQ